MIKNLAIPNINEVMNYLFELGYEYKIFSNGEDRVVIEVKIFDRAFLRCFLDSTQRGLEFDGFLDVSRSLSSDNMETCIVYLKDMENLIKTGTTGRDLP